MLETKSLKKTKPAKKITQKSPESLKPKRVKTKKVKVVNKNNFSLKNITLLTFILVFIWLLVSFIRLNSEVKMTISGDSSNEEVVEEIGRHFVLPEGNPQVITIEEAQILQSKQEFFGGVKDGDKILLYRDIAIIYAMTENKILRIGPITTSPGLPIKSDNVEEKSQVEALLPTDQVNEVVTLEGQSILPE